MARKKTTEMVEAKPMTQAQQIRDMVASFDRNKKFVTADILKLLPNVTRNSVQTALLDMHNNGQVTRVRTGIYRRSK